MPTNLQDMRPTAPHRRNDKWIILVLLLPVLVVSGYFCILYFQCRWTIERHWQSQRWPLPSTLYADAPVLKRGMTFPSKKLVQYFDRLDYHKTSGKEGVNQSGEYKVGPTVITFQKRTLFPDQQGFDPVRVEIDDNRIRRLVDVKTGRRLDAYDLEPFPIRNVFGNESEKRRIVSYKELPPELIHAVIAVEDRRFYQHHGVDFAAILRAIGNNLTGKATLQGGSTITQQFIKNFFLTPKKSIHRKISEAFMAMMLERRLSKQSILELYLNEIYLGQSGAVGIHGVGEASHFYFAKDVRHLTLPEAALLAGMIQAPTTYNPYRHKEDSRKRRDMVLLSMRNLNYITPRQYETAMEAPVTVHPPESSVNVAPYFGEFVTTQLAQKYDPETISKNLSVFTTLDIDMQEAAEEALRKGLDRIDKARSGSVGKKIQGCLIALEPATGFIRAFVGGRDYSKAQFNHINQAFRQPGSVFKPVVYAAALERNFDHASQKASFTPATLIHDEPFALKNANEIWEPKNYDGQYHGPVTLRTALAQSFNVATARLATEIGWDQIASLARGLGFTNLKPYPSVALGVFEATPWQVASAYTAFANGGERIELRFIKRITNADQEVLERSETSTKEILHPQTAFLITDMLRSVMLQGTAASSRQSGFTRAAAGKTGTTDDFRDAWFAGYIPQLLCVVWVGYDDNSSIEMNGAQAALPIWLDFMKKATGNIPEKEFPIPEGIVVQRIDPYTGLLATAACPVTTNEIFIKGTEPQISCQEHQHPFWAFWRDDRVESPRDVRSRRGSTFFKKLKRLFHF